MDQGKQQDGAGTSDRPVKPSSAAVEDVPDPEEDDLDDLDGWRQLLLHQSLVVADGCFRNAR